MFKKLLLSLLFIAGIATPSYAVFEDDGTDDVAFTTQTISMAPPGGGGGSADVTDTFTGGAAALNTHTADTGQTWAFVGASANTMELDGAGKLINTGPFPDGGYGYQSSFVPSDADYCGELTIDMGGTSSGENSAAVAIRQTASGTDSYIMNWVAGSGYQIRLSNGLTQVGSTYAGDTPNTPMIMRLCVAGTSLTGYVNGVSRITGTNGTISGTGRAGIYSEVVGTGANTYDDFKVYNTAP